MQLLFGLPLLLAASSIGVSARPFVTETRCKNAAFFLAGDSTTAFNAGWGNGFITTIKNGSFGMNYGHSGATTVSYRETGDWAIVLSQVKKSKGLGYDPIVTIQVHTNASPGRKAKADGNSSAIMIKRLPQISLLICSRPI
jgi:hypothetical protein